MSDTVTIKITSRVNGASIEMTADPPLAMDAEITPALAVAMRMMEAASQYDGSGDFDDEDDDV